MDHRRSAVPYVVFSLSFLAVGLLLSVFFGLGWLFLLLAARRMLTALPVTRRGLRRVFADLPEDNPSEDRQLAVITAVLRVGAALAWLALAVLIFLQGNPALVDFLPLRR